METVKPDVSDLAASQGFRSGNTTPMRKTKSPTGLFHARTFRGISQDALSRESGVPKSQISKLETANTPHSRELTRTWAEKFAPALNMDPERILFWDKYGPPTDEVGSEDVAAGLRSPRKRVLVVKGYVGAGSEAHYYALAQGDLDEIDAHPGDPPKAAALEIKGTSLGRFLNGWYVIYDDVRAPITDDLIGRLCAVGLSDDRVLVKKIERAAANRFNLLSNDNQEPPILNVEIEWGAKVRMIRPA